ncbi:isoprenoid biosynthesis glyoxalase ElbB [Candidatus Magnetaquicoccus inordinatus]|uniref:isoprenoid biosynthesis glyoxalase ElbB n=1 Tax=Candidatus Magnetaquicoccus inordinatus TaxID=2496818 RepID=UPI00187D55D9|nr:isoprenoid biosynthesis glyoxalase ElbB [Candidatus Magnetaquicoccus inordinatus]
MRIKRIGVVLAGCGVYDGAEIHEATLTLYFLDRAGADIVCTAPDILQHHVINHFTGTETSETRNVLVEASRIARGKITDLSKISANDLDGIILPGGFGAAKNLSTLAFSGSSPIINSDLARLLNDLHSEGKPIGAICISPAVVALALKEKGVLLTIGDDKETAASIEATGNRHQESKYSEIVVDSENKIVSTSAYMCAQSIGEAGVGIEKLVQQVLSWS